MRKQEFPDGSLGLIYGPDGPARRTRAHTLAGYTEPVLHHAGRNDAMMDEESAWLNGAFMEPGEER